MQKPTAGRKSGGGRGVVIGRPTCRAPSAGLNRIRFQGCVLNPVYGIPLAATMNARGWTVAGQPRGSMPRGRDGLCVSEAAGAETSSIEYAETADCHASPL